MRLLPALDTGCHHDCKQLFMVSPPQQYSVSQHFVTFSLHI